VKILDNVTVRVTAIKPFGAFVKLNNMMGFIHISEIDDKFVANISDYFNVGDLINVTVVGLEDDKVSFSYKKRNTFHPKIKNEIRLKKGFTPLLNNLEIWQEQEND